ncbi:Ribosome assembly protein 3 [Hondaea fermentalgiana]|uniref:Ribosome assembly protein 3 n=1 Tax=Hondaea fermentalgiana TaxID=2315210 RepID=A0A2R5G912_9STRA|nr:Ribosome assembly protein 3 [Hondaea fermentalgiana]|eukprot:GBG24973.1 Ribosome assembly protein 3 [Hondaea fermentalgiana]
MEGSLEARRALDQVLKADNSGSSAEYARDKLIDAVEALAKDDLLPGLQGDRLPASFVQAELWRAVRAKGRPATAVGEAAVEADDKTRKSQYAKFDGWYMEHATRALGNELDRLRKDEVFRGDEEDIQVLVDSLRVGAQDAIFDADLKAICTANRASASSST